MVENNDSGVEEGQIVRKMEQSYSRGEMLHIDEFHTAASVEDLSNWKPSTPAVDE